MVSAQRPGPMAAPFSETIRKIKEMDTEFKNGPTINHTQATTEMA